MLATEYGRGTTLTSGRCANIKGFLESNHGGARIAGALIVTPNSKIFYRQLGFRGYKP